MKTVAHVRAIYGGLSETFIYTVLRGLRQFRPIVLAQRSVNEELFPTPGLFVAPHKSRSLAGVLRVLAQRLRLRTNPWLTRRAATEANHYFERILRQEDACLVHAHFGPEGVRLLPLVRRLRIPMVTTFYGYDMSQLGRDLAWQQAYRDLFQHGQLFLIEGPTMRRQLIELGCPPEKASVQPIPVDLSRYTFRERQPSADGSIRLLFCGRFVEKKGLEYALRALALAVRCRPNVQLRVIGDGELRPDIVRIIAELSLTPNVHLLGSRTHAETITELEQAHIVVQPSVTAKNGDSEGGAPTILLEAQACGLPIIATRHADIPFVVSAAAGLLAEERNFEELSMHILDLAARPGCWATMGKAGRIHVEKQHDVNATTRQLEQSYFGLLAPQTELQRH